MNCSAGAQLSTISDELWGVTRGCWVEDSWLSRVCGTRVVSKKCSNLIAVSSQKQQLRGRGEAFGIHAAQVRRQRGGASWTTAYKMAVGGTGAIVADGTTDVGSGVKKGPGLLKLSCKAWASC
ncbi:unnamed protein product [Nippostrongylus brasiliensis]|uniref:Uncharacterized protein n=1 Tax=Nippostrongylus brasiliensis TaxID=27835 RepID=A0A0N4XD67_NIPBR|nr:unnamed protein product [Nippostrongylus brasiliensis]